MVSLDDLRNEELNKNHKIVDVKLIIDNPNLRLEQIYFWLIDYIRDGVGLSLDKVSDEFGGSPGSMFFGDLSARFSRILDTARSMGGLINEIIKSIISQLNEYKLVNSRVKLYDEIKSNDLEVARSAYIRLKQIWVDTVDSQTSNALRNLSRIGFTTAMDIFFLYDIKEEMEKLKNKKIISDVLFESIFPSSKDPNKKDEDKDISNLVNKNIINTKVGNIVKAKLIEFYNWLESSESDLRNRRETLRAYLMHQLNSLIYYLEVAKPYFRFARKLLQKEYDNPDVVSILETAILEITLLSYDKGTEIEEWSDEKNDVVKNTYYSLYEISMVARLRPTNIYYNPREMTTMYTFTGRIDFNFRVYLVKKEELDEIKQNEDIKDLLYIQGMTEEFLKYIANNVFTIFLEELVLNDENIKKTLKEKFNIEIKDYRDLEKIKWTKEVVEEILKNNKDLDNAIGWIKKYLPSSENKKEENNKDQNQKNNENKSQVYKKYSNPFSILLEPFVSLYTSIKGTSPHAGGNVELYSGILEPIMEKIVMFGRKEEKITKPKKKALEDESKKKKSDLKSSAIGTFSRIYNSFKQTFGLLS